MLSWVLQAKETHPLALVFSYHIVQWWKSAAYRHVFELVDFLNIKASPLAVCWSLFRSYPSGLLLSQQVRTNAALLPTLTCSLLLVLAVLLLVHEI